MARKTLEDFNYDYQAYADYLESAECANDDGYDTYVDGINGHIYEPIDGDWTKGHSHENTNTGWKRDKDDPKSKGRDWKNNWAALSSLALLAYEDLQLVQATDPNEYVRKSASSLLKTRQYQDDEFGLAKKFIR